MESNWPEYDRALVQQGDVTVWLDEEFVRTQWRPAPSGKQGAPMKYSAILIMTPSYPISGFRGRTIEFFGL